MRNFFVASQGSRDIERLCNDVLEPAADFFNGGSFRSSGMECVDRGGRWAFGEGEMCEANFSVQKNIDEETGGLIGLTYEISVTNQRLWQKGEYWPDEEFYFDEENMDDEAREIIEQGLHSVGVDEYEEYEEDRFVAEVWEFQIEEDGFIPRKIIRYHYLDEDEFFVGEECSINPDITRHLLTVEEENDFSLTTIENDTALQMLDAEVHGCFSSEDIDWIVGTIARLGYTQERTTKKQRFAKACAERLKMLF